MKRSRRPWPLWCWKESAPWLIALGSLAVVALIGLAIFFNWGGQPGSRSRPADSTADQSAFRSEPERSPRSQPTEKPREVQKDLTQRRDGEDLAATREGTRDSLGKEGSLKPIDEPAQEVKQEMTKMFPQRSRDTQARNPEEVRDFYGSEAVPQPKADVNPAEPKRPEPVVATPMPPAPGSTNPTMPAAPSQRAENPPPRSDPPIPTPNPVPTRERNAEPIRPAPAEASAPAKTTDPGKPPVTAQPKGDAPPPVTSKDKAPPPDSGTPRRPAGGEGVMPRPGQPPVAAQPTPSTPQVNPGKPAAPPVPEALVVRRDARPARAGQFGTIGQAIASARAAHPGEPIVIDIQDNGPLFEAPLELKNQSLILRAAPGYRPIVALDFDSAGAGARFLLSVENGNLVLENVDLALKVPESFEEEDVGLIHLRQGNLLVENCSLSIAGRSRAGACALRLDKPEDGSPRTRAWLRGSFFRGSNLVAVFLGGNGE